ncbi:MAG: FAD-binding oxidoreductase [Rhodoferax sp.]|nr:FAD-binding oxidoreductase [Rhodoferax sp.]
MRQAEIFDVAVIGAGIAGASLAYRLAGRRSVVLLERESQPGYHSTGRSAAMFMESYGPPAVRALTRASRLFFTQPPAGFADRPLLAARDAMYLASPDQQALMERQYRELVLTCPDLERLDQHQTLARVPCLRPDRVHGSLLDRGAMDIDVDALHQGFLRGIRQSGGVLRTLAEVQNAQRRNQLWELGLGDGTYLLAHTVVNAAGAWADQLGSVFGARPIGLVPHRRTAFTFKPPEGMLVAGWPLVATVAENFYFKPDAGVLLGSPANADATVAHDVVPEELDVATGIHHIEAATTLTIRRPLRSWSGLRSFVPDGEMVIGWDAQCDNFLWLAGQGGYGIQSAPGASELAASLVLGLPLPDGLARHGVMLDCLSPMRLR